MDAPQVDTVEATNLQSNKPKYGKMWEDLIDDGLSESDIVITGRPLTAIGGVASPTRVIALDLTPVGSQTESLDTNIGHKQLLGRF